MFGQKIQQGGAKDLRMTSKGLSLTSCEASFRVQGKSFGRVLLHLPALLNGTRTGSQMSWQNWTVATKLTVAVEGKRNALKSANKSRLPRSTCRAGKMIGSRGHLRDADSVSTLSALSADY